MPNITTQIIKLSNFPVSLPNVPPNYPIGPKSGKIELLLNSNDNYLYHKFTPFTNYKDSILGGLLSDKQPFVYTFIDEKGKSKFDQLPKSVKGLANTVNINGESLNDVVRISKFLISSWGVQFLITQAAIQRLASFDETRLYNPLSPILSTISPLTLGIGESPIRHIEGGLLGLANSVTSTVGINLQSGYQKPSSTAGDINSLPTINSGQGKGMIRGTDAASGLLSFQSKWAPANTTSGGSILGKALNNFANSVGNSFKSFFGNPQKSTGIFRADETGYTIMSLGFKDLNQSWFASSDTNISNYITKNKSTIGIINNNNTEITGLFIKKKLISLPDRFDYVSTVNGLSGPNIGIKNTGYSFGEKYGDVVGRLPYTNEEDMTNSDMLVQYGYYVKNDNNYPSKYSDFDKAEKLNSNLKKVISNINSNTIYNSSKIPWTFLLPSGDNSDYVEYDNWSNKQRTTAKKGVSGEYSNTSGISENDVTIPKSIDSFIKPSPNNLRMATTFISDGLNMLGVLSGDKNVNGNKDDNTYKIINKTYTGWTEWKPYEDDLIAFFFYDVVNDKYIPFRATVKGISEGGTAYWDELRFIGRADQLYSYNGFSRNLSFNFNVVINSLSELLPSWKKINYIASCIKPSNYTKGQVINQDFNRFIVPPMFMITIGDLYKYQPVVINTVNVNIPEDAIWETLNENNSKEGWSYLNGLVTSPMIGKNYGQLPREAEISITCNVLEKERSIVGGSHFGHEPRSDVSDLISGNDKFISDNSVPFLPVPTTLHKNFIEWVN